MDDGEFIAIVNGLQNGELSAVGVVPCPIGRVAVSKKALDEFRLRWAIQHHRGLSIDQAANLLELKQQVTYQLARLGLLRTDENPEGRLAVSMAQIQRFQRKYASLQSIAMNTSPRAALAHISATPVAGPSMHNCRQYFFRRSDVAELLEDQ
ncbi:hypothetical protein LQR31_05530 [Chromobacterium vaccinii]|uniref:hypothetical protein n=1 Tax=Chromobacterium vaccinii TaxID=1108595 RepID=UPI001E5F1A41|nr:hypothetical protein [Chromobacterium vaccinii]MCD4483934.1 hypothetical protein [Chromobacterium vaccinii]